MDPILLALLGLGGMFALIMLHIPIGIAMAISGIVGFGFFAGFGPAVTVLATETSSVLSSVDLAVIPLFLLMGGFATVSGLSSDIYRLAYSIIGHRRGGLALATIGGCAAFGAVCGTSVATAATMGRVALPEMLHRGYAPALATGCIAAGGTLGMLVPPSVIMVVYAFLTEQFVITLFVAAVVPALVAVSFHVVAIELYVRANPEAAPPGPRMSWRDRLGVARECWGVLALLVTVIGGIYGGVFTVTEAASWGAGLAFLFTVIRRRLNQQMFWQVLVETATNAAMIYLIIIGASIFSYFISATKMPSVLVQSINDMNLPPMAVIAALMLMYLVLGSIFETVAAMLITIPFAYPLVTGLGYDPIWWGVVMVMVIEVGMITPPIGMNVFVLHGVARDVPLSTIFKGIVPFLCADLIRIAVIIVFPGLALWLPGILAG